MEILAFSVRSSFQQNYAQLERSNHLHSGFRRGWQTRQEARCFGLPVCGTFVRQIANEFGELSWRIDRVVAEVGE
jgi:hypothetical protein